MNQELIDRIEKLAAVECGRDCAMCYGTGKRWWPLAEFFQPDGLQDEPDCCFLSAVEQCLSMAGSWDYTYFCGANDPHRYDMLGTNLIVDGPDRLTAAVECLESVDGR